MRPWFIRDPERLEQELKAFEAFNIAVAIDEAAREAEFIRLQIAFPGPAGVVRLRADYPDLFPFFKPEVYSDDIVLSRHQNPLSGNVCLIGRRTGNWNPEDTLAAVLITQLRSLLDFHRSGDLAPLAAVEEPQGEPASEYYNGAAAKGSFLLVDTAWRLPDSVEKGSFVACLTEAGRDEHGDPILQGRIDEIRDSEGVVLAQWTGPRINEEWKRVEGRWLRVREPLQTVLVAHDGEVEVTFQAAWDWMKDEESWSRKRHLALGLIVFSEEVQHQKFAVGFVAVQWDVSRQKRGAARLVRQRFVRTCRAGTSDLAARMPFTAPLHEKSVTLFGVGAIGAPVAIELARAGLGRLTIVDHDFMEPATARRWPLGASGFGESKVERLRERLADDYPWTEYFVDEMKIGSATPPTDEKLQGERVEELIAHADLIVDCTVELGVNQFLAYLSQARGIPYLLGNATPGAWGGMVAAFRPGEPCWTCFRHALYGEQPSVALPAADPEGDIQPPGCTDPTFTGAAFDLTEVSLEIVRAAVGILSGADRYPSAPCDAAILDLREAGGARMLPQWRPVVFRARPNCDCVQR